MKKLLFFAFAIAYFMPLKAQGDFEEQFKIYSKIRNDFSGGSVATVAYQSSQLTIITQMLVCLKAVKSEEEYIRMYDLGGQTYGTNSLSGDEKVIMELNKKLLARVKTYDSMLYGHKYYEQAFNFFNRNKSFISIEQPVKEKSAESVIHFKKKLYEYTPTQLYWLLEFSCSIDADRIDISRKEVDLVMKKVEQSSLPKNLFSVLEYN